MNNIDEKIIGSIREGNNDKALSYLYEKPLNKIRKYIIQNSGTNDDANDVFQDAVIILFHQVKKNKYKEEYDLEAFLFAVARNLWINKVKRDMKMVKQDFEPDFPLTDFNDQLKDLIGKEKSAAFSKAFESLEEKCRQLLHFVIYDKLSLKVISEKMGFSNENVVKTKHFRCKQYLMKLISENSELLNLLKN